MYTQIFFSKIANSVVLYPLNWKAGNFSQRLCLAFFSVAICGLTRRHYFWGDLHQFKISRIAWPNDNCLGKIQAQSIQVYCFQRQNVPFPLKQVVQTACAKLYTVEVKFGTKDPAYYVWVRSHVIYPEIFVNTGQIEDY